MSNRTARPTTYRMIHRLLHRLRGPATDHTCSCGQPAQDWAYQFTGETLRASDDSHPHSVSPDDYAAMCRDCHARFDVEHDSHFAERRRVGAVNGQAAFRDNVSLERQHEISVLGGLASWRDPEVNERRREAQRKTARRRRRCLECGFISNPGGMGTHRTRTGHNNYEEVLTDDAM